MSFKDSSLTHAHAVIKELVRQQQEFFAIAEMECKARESYFSVRVGAKKRVRISFGSEEEIERIRKDGKHKLNTRNALGIKSPEDWIYNLNIGNIMHLVPLGFDEIQLQATT